jgi:type 1 glutamine amidotransferase
MIGTHSATDTFGGFRPYFSLINGTFDGHPWGSGENCAFTNHEPGHATSKMLGEEFQWKDEIYQYKNYDPKSVRVLYSLNMAKCKTKQPYHVPVSWVRESGQGRLFYTNLGHNEGTWATPLFKQHLLAGIRWALKLEEGSAAPNPELQYQEQAKAFIQVAGGGAEALLAKVAAAKDVEKLAALYKKIDDHRRGKGDKAALKDEILADIGKL